MRVLIADAFETSGRDGLAAIGCEVVYEPKLKDAALVEAIQQKQPDVLVVRSTQVSEAAINAGQLKLIVRAGAGYNTIDVAAASKRGVYVSNCPGKNAVAVAELAFGLMLALDRRIADNVITMRSGQWNKTEFSKARGLFGRTLGIIGMGQIAQEVVTRAQAFGMNVVAWSRSLTEEQAEQLGVQRKASPLEVAAAADVVSVHLALNKETRGFIGKPFFDAMRTGAYFINTSRGEVVDQDAMLTAIRDRGLRAGLDVFANEPTTGVAEFNEPIGKEPAVYGTHHIGASTEQAQEAIAAETVRIIRAFQETGRVPNAVNIAERSPATCMLVVRHRDRPGVLARVLDAISTARINVQEMENVIFSGFEAAVARIHLESEPPAEMVESLRKSDADIFELRLAAIENAGK